MAMAVNKNWGAALDNIINYSLITSATASAEAEISLVFTKQIVIQPIQP